MSSVPLSHKSIQKVGNRTIRVGYLRKSLGLLLKKSKKYFSIERETFSTWLLIHRKRQLLYVNSLAELKLVGDIQCEYRPEYRLWSVYRGIKEKPRDSRVVQERFYRWVLKIKHNRRILKWETYLALFTAEIDDWRWNKIFSGALEILQPYLDDGKLIGEINYISDFSSEIAKSRMQELIDETG